MLAPSILRGRVRAARIQAGITKFQLTALVGCHWTIIAAVEHGESSPRTRTPLRLANALAVDPRCLVDGLPAELADPAEIDLRA